MHAGVALADYVSAATSAAVAAAAGLDGNDQPAQYRFAHGTSRGYKQARPLSTSNRGVEVRRYSVVISTALSS